MGITKQSIKMREEVGSNTVNPELMYYNQQIINPFTCRKQDCWVQNKHSSVFQRKT